jgi:hypothetical protein
LFADVGPAPVEVIDTGKIQPGIDNAPAWWAQAEGCPQTGPSGTGPSPLFESDKDRTSFVIRLPVHERAVQVHAPEVTLQVGTKLAPSRNQVTGEVAGEVRRLLGIVEWEMLRRGNGWTSPIKKRWMSA